MKLQGDAKVGGIIGARLANARWLRSDGLCKTPAIRPGNLSLVWQPCDVAEEPEVVGSVKPGKARIAAGTLR